jgi:hypothetical protein
MANDKIKVPWGRPILQITIKQFAALISPQKRIFQRDKYWKTHIGKHFLEDTSRKHLQMLDDAGIDSKPRRRARLARYAADRRGLESRRRPRRHQASGRFGWRDSHAGPRRHRGRDHAVSAAQRIIPEIRPQTEHTDRSDNTGNHHRDQFSTLVFSGHCLVLHSIHADVFTGIDFEIVNNNRLNFYSPARSSTYATAGNLSRDSHSAIFRRQVRDAWVPKPAGWISDWNGAVNGSTGTYNGDHLFVLAGATD